MKLITNVNDCTEYMHRKVAVVACMDARLDPAQALGIELGSAHVIRNAGGRAADALRSIIISQQLLGTREIIIVHHVRILDATTFVFSVD